MSENTSVQSPHCSHWSSEPSCCWSFALERLLSSPCDLNAASIYRYYLMTTHFFSESLVAAPADQTSVMYLRTHSPLPISRTGEFIDKYKSAKCPPYTDIDVSVRSFKERHMTCSRPRWNQSSCELHTQIPKSNLRSDTLSPTHPVPCRPLHSVCACALLSYFLTRWSSSPSRPLSVCILPPQGSPSGVIAS